MTDRISQKDLDPATVELATQLARQMREDDEAKKRKEEQLAAFEKVIEDVEALKNMDLGKLIESIAALESSNNEEKEKREALEKTVAVVGGAYESVTSILADVQSGQISKKTRNGLIGIVALVGSAIPPSLQGAWELLKSLFFPG